MTRKEQKEERRKTILMTALTLFVEKGYHDTKITDIAEAVPMSTGLLFHYFASKEELLEEVVRMGAEGTKSLGSGRTVPAEVPPDVYLTGFLRQMFLFAGEQRWVFYMFVLMGQVRRNGMPEQARRIADSVDSVGFTAQLIERGQQAGIFREGDSRLLARCFWASVQGIMEEMALDPGMEAPDPAWLVDMLRGSGEAV
ncbi:MAG: TetR/AcrR family transcriptional regulator [Lachnospiraceae bacterium]|nr:TetR/AcrR family transcriptional regulator [Lachnospiraceae bacterium]